MNSLVTGGGGFVGFNLVNRLTELGCSVGVLVRTQANLSRLSSNLKVRYIPGDVTDLESLKSAISSFNPDIIFHLASYGAYPRFQNNFSRMLDVNVKGIENIVLSAKEIPVINTGSSSEYGLKDSPMLETDVCNPHLNYGISKLAQTLFAKKSGIPTLRLFSVYGPFEDENRLVPVLMNAKLNDVPVNLIESVRDYVYSEDVAEAYVLAGLNYEKIKGSIINIGSGLQTQMRKVLEIIDDFGPKKLKVNWQFQKIQEEPKSWVADISRARDLLKWKPCVSLEQGLRSTYDFWRQSK
jgi:nucleoside-diphosphate-sugar epimerase